MPTSDQKAPGLAIASVICGPLGFLTAGLSGIAAIITGHMALSVIKRSGGRLKGSGLAITGLITGYLSILILPIAILAGLAAPVILKQRQKADLTESVQNTRMLHLAFIGFDSEYGSFPSDELAKEVPKFAGLTGPRVLEQLEVAGMVDDVDRLLAAKAAPGSKWYYFPSMTSSGKFDQRLLMGPVIGDRYATLRIDGSVKAEPSASLSPADITGSVEIPVPQKKR